MFTRVLVANRGVAAIRITRTLRRLNITAIAVHTQPDRHAPHTAAADRSIPIDTYLNVDSILQAAHRSGAQAIHPGYGFLAENADFAQACLDANLTFIGPTPQQIQDFGLKHRARALAEAARVPLAPGSPLLPDAAAAHQAAERIGYPVMLKSTAGGGGIGLLRIDDPAALEAAFHTVAQQAQKAFANPDLFLERYIPAARHIEVQIFGDGQGRVLTLGDRDCSAQRRHQKIIEEAPAPDLPTTVRTALHDAARRLAQSVNYANAGTVEFIYDPATQSPYFLEVNTRLQVEHGITDAIYGIDLVEWMLRQAAGEPLPKTPEPHGHAIEARLYAEDPAQDFRPAAGRLTQVAFPPTATIESCVETGTEISPFYDPMLATVIATGPDRQAALQALRETLAATRLDGTETNLDYLRHLLDTGALNATITTATLAACPYHPPRIVVLDPGTETTIQDWPGRQGYWHVGVPPSGPMDDRSFRLANRAVGNPEGAPGLEIVVSGPTLRFDTAALVCLAGAPLPATLNGTPIPYWEPIAIRPGALLAIGAGALAGARTYLAIQGGLDVPEYLGSRSTFTLGGFGGHQGRPLRPGDILRPTPTPPATPPAPIPKADRPTLTNAWTIAVLDGPHGAPDFLTPAGIEALYAATWTVHYNSSRTGIRLLGPRPQWARAHGGEAGLHPSNIHDTPYAIGAIDLTGDTPIILGPDGPSLGGFVCPITITTTDLWKTGQLRPGDTIQFQRDAEKPSPALAGEGWVRVASPNQPKTPSVTYRQSGNASLLVEYGDPVLDLALRFRIHLLHQAIEAAKLPGIIDLTPGIRALQIHHDPATLPLPTLMATLADIETTLPDAATVTVPSRTIHLPLSWDDPATRLAIDRYIQGVRPDAPWCPSNIEFIRRINGLDTIDDVKRIVLSAEYLVLGLGDVYLGAPVATPLDPRHRLVTTKYNPARTWTPENAVGIGGAYLCVYGMEGPGGYQFVGRTCQVWNTHRTTGAFPPGQPWLLRFFDRIRFHEVSPEALLQFRDDFPQGKAHLEITEGTFSLRDHQAFLATQAAPIAAFKSRQQAAFDAERARWAETDRDHDQPEPSASPPPAALPPGHIAVTSPVAGGVWKLMVAEGDPVAAGQVLLVLDSMKVQMSVPAPRAGTVAALRCTEGAVVAMGQRLIDLA